MSIFGRLMARGGADAATELAPVVGAISGSFALYLLGFLLFYIGERPMAEDPRQWAVTGAGVVFVVLSLALRGRRVASSAGERRGAEVKSLAFAAVGFSAILLYALRADGVVGALGLVDEAADRWDGVLTVLSVLAWFLGTVPYFVVDQALSRHPVLLPPAAARRAMHSGLAAALGIALAFPVNYLSANHNTEWDYAYFKVTKPGTSTLALVTGLDQPIEAYLFFSPGDDVGREIDSYFREIEAASSGRFVVQYVDQAVEPKLSEELKVRENGYVAFKQGEATEKFKLGTDLDKARRELKKLDETVQKHLLKIARGPRVAYLLVGHGEASSKEKDEPLRKLNLFKQLLEGQNYKVKNFGVADGSTDAVPDDAAVLIIAAPDKPLLPEEERAIGAYVDRGGRLLIMVEPGQDPLSGVLGKLGLQAGGAPLANAKYFVPQSRGPADRVLLFSNRFGSHEAVTTLSKNSTQLAVLMPTVAALTEAGETTGKRTVLIRTPENTWADLDGDRELGAGEKGEVHVVAYAVSGGEGDAEHRAIVLGDVSILSDPVLQVSLGNQQLALDGTRWLVGDEELAGTTESEEDVKIEHTRDEDVAWFYGTIFGVPLLVLVGGLVFTTTRRRSK